MMLKMLQMLRMLRMLRMLQFLEMLEMLEDCTLCLREIYREGLCLHGGYFQMLESGWRRREHPNIMFFW